VKLEEVIVEFHRLGLPEIREREIELPLNVNKAITVTGMRRTGKTYLLYQTMKKLLGRGREIRELFYINFEDERLEGMSSENLSEIVELYRKHNPDSDTMYLFLDEVQIIDGWEKFVRRLLERRDVRIFLTGSSSRLMSREIATSLRGRSLSYHLFPLSFREFLEFKGENFEEPLIEDERGRIMGYLEEYMEFGGFPEIVSYREFEHRMLKIRTLKEYLDLIVYRDLVERYGIEKTGAMKALIRVITKNFGNRISVNKLHNMLVSSGTEFSRTSDSSRNLCIMRGFPEAEMAERGRWALSKGTYHREGLPRAQVVAGEAVPLLQILDPHAEAARDAIERVSLAHAVFHPVAGDRGGIDGQRGRGGEGDDEILPGADSVIVQVVGLHQGGDRDAVLARDARQGISGPDPVAGPAQAFTGGEPGEVLEEPVHLAHGKQQVVRSLRVGGPAVEAGI